MSYSQMYSAYVTGRRSTDNAVLCTLQVMIYLIDRVLPECFFANNLRALFVDMAVFRDLMRLRLPRLSRHLDRLRATSPSHHSSGQSPPPWPILL